LYFVDDLLDNPSNRSSLDEAGVTIHKAAGLDDGNGRQFIGLSHLRRSCQVLNVLPAESTVFIMSLAYWNGLQMLQYSSNGLEKVGIGEIEIPTIAEVGEEIFASIRASPMWRTDVGGMVKEA